jgi:hypothetical protein
VTTKKTGSRVVIATGDTMSKIVVDFIGVGAVRYSFTVTDFHRLPSASLPAHPSTASLAEVTRSSTSLTTNLA